jgi:hypothetical protein
MRRVRLSGFCSFVVLILPIMLRPGPGFAQTGDSWSRWHSTDGEGKIQYRWQTYGGGATVQKCSYQLRNLDSSDGATYDSKVYYTSSRGKDESESGPYLNRTYHDNSGNIEGCTNVSSVMTRRR